MRKLELVDNNRCFACGMDNPEGLRIDWKVDGRIMTGEFVSGEKYQGWKGIVHGGILATLLDEAMTRLAGVVCGGAVTAEMTVRYVAPAQVGERLFIQGEIVDEKRKLVEMKAFIRSSEGTIIAHATGKGIKI